LVFGGFRNYRDLADAFDNGIGFVADQPVRADFGKLHDVVMADDDGGWHRQIPGSGARGLAEFTAKLVAGIGGDQAGQLSALLDVAGLSGNLRLQVAAVCNAAEPCSASAACDNALTKSRSL
jgi:hypothetical protein